MQKNIEEFAKELKEDCIKHNCLELFEPFLKTYGKYFILKGHIKGAKNIDELDDYVDELAKILEEDINLLKERRIQDYQEKRIKILTNYQSESKPIEKTEVDIKILNESDEAHYKADDETIKSLEITIRNLENSVSPNTEEINLLKGILATLSEPPFERREDVREIIAKLDSLNKELTTTLLSVQVLIAQTPLIEVNGIVKSYEKFMAWRKKRKVYQAIYRFFWAVILAGFVYGVLASNLPKLFVENHWLILVATTIAFLGSILKEYWISPWIRNKRLELQRTHLLSSLDDLLKADLRLNLAINRKRESISGIEI